MVRFLVALAIALVVAPVWGGPSIVPRKSCDFLPVRQAGLGTPPCGQPSVGSPGKSARFAWGYRALADGPPPGEARPIPSHVPGRILVRFKVDQELRLAAQAIPGIGALVMAVPPGEEEARVAAFRADPRVDFAELDGVVRALGEPNDLLYPMQRWNLLAIGAPAAWEAVGEAPGPTIAVVDSGVDLTHPDLEGKLVEGYDFVDGDDQPQDEYGHGTHVAGIVAARANNSAGIAGLSWGSKIMPVRVLDSVGLGSASDVARGIIWAADHGARAINLSIAAPLGGDTVREALRYAQNKGALLVAAAGNSYQQGNPPIFPASFQEVVAVAATNNSGGHASYSSSGAYVSLAAPGGDPQGPQDQDSLHWITSTYARQRGSPYAFLAGTSQAGAHVSGVAALVWAANPALTSTQVRSILETTAKDLGPAGRDHLFGFGLVDAEGAVLAARKAPVWATRLYFPKVMKSYTGGW